MTYPHRSPATRLSHAIAAVGLALFATLAGAQVYPARAIRMIVGAPPGGTTDIVARLVAGKLQERLNQPVVVENRGGVGGNIGMDAVAKAAPDGYTLGLAYSGLSINPTVIANMPFDTLNDLAPVSLVATVQMFLIAGPMTKVTTVKDLIAEAKAHPGDLAFGVNSLASVGHLSAELFKTRAGVDMPTIVYKGSSQAWTDLIGGRLAVMFDTVPGAYPLVKSGQLRALAMGSDKRSSLLPDVPTLQEAGLTGFDIRSWYGVIAPARTPPEIVNLISREIADILKTKDMRDRFAAQSLDPVGSTPAEFSSFIRAEMRVWEPVAKSANIKLE